MIMIITTKMITIMAISTITGTTMVTDIRTVIPMRPPVSAGPSRLG